VAGLASAVAEFPGHMPPKAFHALALTSAGLDKEAATAVLRRVVGEADLGEYEGAVRRYAAGMV
jgi:hypothetical protein